MYYIQGIGYHPIDPKHLPTQTHWINKIDLLELYIVKLSNDYWVQKNYVSGTIRAIIKTKDVLEIKTMEEKCKKLNLEKINVLFERVDEIIKKQEELAELFFIE